MEVTIRLLCTFCPPGQDRDDYLAEAISSARNPKKLNMVLPVLLLRRGPNARATPENAPGHRLEAAP